MFIINSAKLKTVKHPYIPKGIWMACKKCSRADKIVGSGSEDWHDIPFSEIAKVFRRNGWVGHGDRMIDQRCPDCAPEVKYKYEQAQRSDMEILVDLRADRDGWRRVCEGLEQDTIYLKENFKALEADNKRLRQALERIKMDAKDRSEKSWYRLEMIADEARAALGEVKPWSGS